jgi:SAM-dependent methyltransferase
MLREERAYLQQFLVGAGSALDICCGAGRIIPIVRPLIERYYGVDIDEAALAIARAQLQDWSGSSVYVCDAQQLHMRNDIPAADVAFSLFNSMSAIDDPADAVRSVSQKVRDKVLLTFQAKGYVGEREAHYHALGIAHTVEEHETFVSRAYGRIRAYSLDEVLAIVCVPDFAIAACGSFGDLSHYAVLRRDSSVDSYL